MARIFYLGRFYGSFYFKFYPKITSRYFIYFLIIW